MTPARRTPARRGRPTYNDDTSATWATEPSRRGRRRQRYCRGVRAVAGIGRRTWCCRDRRAAASGFNREATINMLLGGCVWQDAGVGGAWRPPRPPSETTSLALASRSAAAAFFARMDVRSVAMGGGDDGGGGNQMLDGAMRADGGWRRTR
jgi:hypothetical protein